MSLRDITILLLAGLAGIAARTAAQEATPTAYPQRAPEEQALKPPPGHPNAGGSADAFATLPPPRRQPLPRPAENVRGSIAMAAPSQSSQGAGALKDIQAIRLKEGEAQIRIGGQVRTLRPGDTLGTDVVRRIEDGQIVLTRPERSGGDSRVVIDFDAAGRARVRIFMTQDRSAEP